MASRLLRSNLLQPPRVQSIVEGRLDAVDELLANEDRFDRLRSALVPLAKVDLDKLISGLTHDPTTTTRAGVGGGATEVSRAERRVVQMLMVRTAVGAFRGLSEALQGVQSELLVKCRVVLDDEQLAVMDQVRFHRRRRPPHLCRL
jgi:DNA mismatch repair protein MSH4